MQPSDQQSTFERFIEAMQHLLMAMKQVDGTCVEVTDDIDKRDLHALIFIGDNEDVKMKDIAGHLDVPLSTTTGIVQKLVDKQLVMRTASPADRRAVLLQLTPDGQG
ncbi:MAG: MarR family transcriptional regulator, partial [Saprospiraceae bacterium]|nr:MarR family transcriptional regulator [Saprospiraceae bacterium]